MADIQPKNTDTVRVNKIKEKTPGSKITLDNITLVDEVREKTAAAGITLNQLLKLTTALIPTVATMDIGTTTAAEHIREAFINEVTNADAADVFRFGTDSNTTSKWKTNALDRFSLETNGDLKQDATNGGSILLNQKASTALAQTSGIGLTATGTTIADALALTAVYSHLGAVAAGTGVKLWDAPQGSILYILNNGANAVTIYPTSLGDTIAGYAAGAGASLAVGALALLLRYSSASWLGVEITSPAL